jgi:hypothetical protein
LSLPIYDERALPEESIGTLTTHKLSHLGDIKVGKSLLHCRMAAACDSNKCTSQCCGTGVLADKAEKERILAHAAEVIATMDDDQPKDPAKWFDDEEVKDNDFPSRVAIGTQTMQRGCIFLNELGRCVLQKANMEGRVPVLKPFYCTAFPVTVDHGMLMLDIDNVEGTKLCCVPSEDGTRTALDVFAYEIEHTIGAEGAKQLKKILDDARGR